MPKLSTQIQDKCQLFSLLDLKFMLYPPVFSSFTIWKLSVLRPNGFKRPFPNCRVAISFCHCHYAAPTILTSLSFPHISPISFSWAALVLGGRVLSCDCTIFLSVTLIFVMVDRVL